ncbi:unnamed protein product, partial [Ectocarpus sp. 12 AP-2014]
HGKNKGWYFESFFALQYVSALRIATTLASRTDCDPMTENWDRSGPVLSGMYHQPRLLVSAASVDRRGWWQAPRHVRAERFARCAGLSPVREKGLVLKGIPLLS